MKNKIIASIVLLVFDALWIILFMGKQYQEFIPRIQGSNLKVNPTYTILSYALMITGLVIFVLPNISKENALQDSLKYGFTFGIVLYGVYDFTAAAVLTEWDIKTALLDILWGGIVFAVSSFIGTKFGD